jgi:polysaccharide biosynthesis protein PslA
MTSDGHFRVSSVLFAIALGGFVGVASLFFLHRAWLVELSYPPLWVPVVGSLTATATLLGVTLTRTWSEPSGPARRVAVVGINSYSHIFVSRMADDKTRTAQLIGLYDDGCATPAAGDTAIPVCGGIDELIARSRHERIDAIVLAFPGSALGRVTHSLYALRSVVSDVYVANELLDLIPNSNNSERFGSSTAVKIARRPLTVWQARQKVVLDVTLASILIVLFSPVLAIISLAIRLDSPGPILFKQKRRGYNQQTFYVLKFRTMYHHMTDPDACQQTVRGDPRVTRVGRVLRRLSLDELPQLLQVLRGEMSIVGPRPHALGTKAGSRLFQDAVADYPQRYRVKPGITGWAQVNGWRGETLTQEQIEQRVAHDLYYINHWSLLLDIKILLLTVICEFNSKVAF